MTRIRFHQELDELKHRILAMAGMSEQAVDLAVQAYVQRDIPAMAMRVRAMVRDALRSFIEGDTELAKHVLEADDEIDRMNHEAFATLSRYMQSQPDRAAQALDALSIARNLERVADHATNIAEDVIFWVRGADVRHGAGQRIAGS